MAQKKGQTGNPNGRPKGTPNKVTADLRTWINDILNDNRLQIENDLKCLEPYQRIAVFEKLLQYALPKQKENINSDELKELREYKEKQEKSSEFMKRLFGEK